jgi:hypothetical protein
VSQFHDASAFDFLLRHEGLIVNKEILSNMSLILKGTIVMRIMPERQLFITLWNSPWCRCDRQGVGVIVDLNFLVHRQESHSRQKILFQASYLKAFVVRHKEKQHGNVFALGSMGFNI